MKRYLVALLSGALLGLTPLTLTAQAAAPAPVSDKESDPAWSAPQQRSARAATVQTKVELESPARRAYYKSSVPLAGRVWAWNQTAGEWQYLTIGTVTLQRSWKGSRTWQTLGAQDLAAVAGRFSFAPSAQRNAAYRVNYSGATSGEYVFTPSATTHSLGVVRRFNESITKRTLVFRGRVVPSFARKPLVIERRTCGSCKWKRYAKIRTDRRSRWSKKLAAPRALGQKWQYRAVAAGSTKFVRSHSRTAVTYRRR